MTQSSAAPAMQWPQIDYKQFLTQLKMAGDKFPFLWKIMLDIVGKAQDAYVLMRPTTPVPDEPMALKLMSGHVVSPVLSHISTLQVDHIPIDAATRSEEQHLVSLLHSKVSAHPKLGEDAALKAIGDGTFLRQLFSFLQSNPQLLTLILSLFGVKIPGAPAVQV